MCNHLIPSVRARWRPAAIVCTAIVATAQIIAAQTHYPIFTADNFVTTMKTVGRNFNGVNQSISKSDFETAKAQLVRSREQLAITITFWRDRQKEDAIRMLKDSLAKMDALDTALSAEQIDAAAVGAKVKEISGACQACHTEYREQDPATKAYRLKAGLTE
jgi:cytochrome c556